jgi:hypothetical protein
MLLLILILLIRVTFSTPTFDFDRHLSAITRYGSAEMKYWRLISVVVVFSFVAIAINNVREKRSQQRRDVAYQTALRSYSEAIKLGMTRKDVEDSLHARNGAFLQMCCVDIRKPWGVLDDLVKIGQEDPPWFCSTKDVYIAFQFAGTRPQATPPSADPSDRVTAVTVYPLLEGCL